MLMIHNGLKIAVIALFTILISHAAISQDTVVKPKKMSRTDIAGEIFSRPDMVMNESSRGTTYDVVSLLSSDGKFVSGMYRAGASRTEITDAYGVNEFMYFIEGSVTLTSSDGSIQTIGPGEAVTIPEEWTGIWETDGYTKIYVIYSKTGEFE